jgi:hypothetical protein
MVDLKDKSVAQIQRENKLAKKNILGWARYIFKVPVNPDGDNVARTDHPRCWPYWLRWNSGTFGYISVRTFMPIGADIKEWWPEAIDVEIRICGGIPISEKYPLPKWYKPF